MLPKSPLRPRRDIRKREVNHVYDRNLFQVPLRTRYTFFKYPLGPATLFPSTLQDLAATPQKFLRLPYPRSPRLGADITKRDAITPKNI